MPSSLFTVFSIIELSLVSSFTLVFEIFDAPLLEGIANDKLFGDDILSDIIIKYFNDHDITEDDLDALDVYNYMDNAMQFYYVPIVIFILEYYIKALMSRQANI